MKSTNKRLALIFIFAFLIRLIALNQSLWLDEGVTVKVVSMFSLVEIIPKFSLGDFHPPLFYFFMKIWTSIFGLSVVSLRIPSVLFSLIAGYIIYRIGVLVKNESIGMWAALFFLFNPLVIYYSQEARMYMMAVLFLTACLYQYIVLLKAKRDEIKPIIYFNGFAFLAFLTFYGSAFFIGSLYLYLAYKRSWRTLLYLLPGFVLSILLVSPLLLTQYKNSKEVLGLVVNWKSVLGQANIKNLLLIPMKFTIGRISFMPKILYYAVVGIGTLFVFLLALFGTQKNKFLGFLFIAPLILGIIFSFLSPLLQYFRFLYLLPVLALLIALGTLFFKKQFRIYVQVGLTLWFVAFSLLYVLLPQFHREDWKSLANAVKNNKQVYMIPSASDALTYYVPHVQIQDIRTVPNRDEKKILVVPYVVDLYGYDYKKTYTEEGFHLKNTYTVREIPYEVWER